MGQTVIPPAQGKRPTSQMFRHGGLNRILCLLRDQFSISTWLCFGASLQIAAMYFVPQNRVIYAPVLLLFFHFVDTMLMTLGITLNRQAEGIILKEKFTAQIPDENGVIPDDPSDQPITIIMLGGRSNHSLGMLAPGFKGFMNRFDAMIRALDEGDADKFGYLGATSWASTDRGRSNEVLSILYFRSLNGLHSFAHSPVHLETVSWWNKTIKEHPHVTLMHEVYDVPRKHWENIYLNNYHVSGIAGTIFRRKDSKEGEAADTWVRPIVDASRGRLRTQMGRIGRENDDDND